MDRKRSFWPWIVTSVILLPVGYVLSFVPIVWIIMHAHLEQNEWIMTAYYYYALPIMYAQEAGPAWVRQAVDLYSDFISRVAA